MRSSEENERPKLTLVKTNKPSDIYGSVFTHFANQVALAKESAHDLYLEMLEEGIDPADLGVDFSLLELDLAEEQNVSDINGLPVLKFHNPDVERAKRILMDTYDEMCDHEPPSA